MSEDNKQEEVKTPEAQEKSLVGAVVGAVAYTMAAEATRSGIRWLRDHNEDIRDFFNRNSENANPHKNPNRVINNGQEGEENHQDMENMIVVPKGKEKFVQMLAKQADFSHLSHENVASKGENVEEKGVRENLIRWGRVIVPVVATAVLRYALGEEFDLGNDNQGEVENNNVAEAIQENVGNVVEGVEPPTLTDEQRQELIEQLSREDAQEFTRAQGEQLHDNIRQIRDYENRYNEAVRPLNEDYFKEREILLDSELGNRVRNAVGEEYEQAKEEFDKLDQELRDKLQERMREQGFGETPDQFANRITGLGNGEESYCISIQTNAMEDAVRETGNDTLGGVRDGVGWTTQYASNFFVENGFGENFERMNQLFTLNEQGQAIVNMDENGNPMIRDGDLAIVDNCHCIRLNVDENGVVTYSAGNNERINAPARWYNISCCTLIHTEDYATSLMQQQYQEMTDEQLLALNNQRHPSTNTNSIDDAMLAYAPKSVDMEYEKGMDTTERRLLSSELERTAKHTLNGTLPLSCSSELREWNRGNTKKLNDRVDNYEALRGRENANSNISAMIKASAERA